MTQSNPFAIQMFIYKIFGLWQFDDEPIYGSIFYKAYGIILHTVFSFVFLFFMFLKGFYISGLDELTEYLYISLTEVGYLFKMTNFVRKRYFIRKLIFQQFRNDLKEVVDTEQQYVQQQLKFHWYLHVAFLAVGLAACGSAFSTPILEARRSLPFPSHYLLDWENDYTSFVIVYVYQFSVTIHCCLTITCDTVLSSSMNCIAILFHTLGENIQRLGSDNILDTKAKIKGYIIRHVELLGYTKSIENVYSVVIFVQFCMSVIVLCVTAFQISIMSPLQNPTNFMLYIFYILAMVAQFYLPCLFGNEIISNSSNLTNKIYFSNWLKYLPDKGYRRMIIIFMERLKRPSKMTAGRLFSLSLQTFTSIINSAYSFYALLQNMQKDSKYS